MNDKVLLTIPEVAQILGVTTNYAYRLAQRGMFPVFRFSRRGIRVPRQAFEEWLREQTVWPADVSRQRGKIKEKDEMRTAIVSLSELHDIDALERMLQGKYIGAVVEGEKAVVLYQPVSDLDWHVSVRDCRAWLMLERDGEVLSEDELELDESLAQELKERVLEEHGAAINENGCYWPLSDETAELGNTLLAAAKVK